MVMNVAEDIENTCLVTMDTVWLGRPVPGKRRGQACSIKALWGSEADFPLMRGRKPLPSSGGRASLRVPGNMKYIHV